jgi:hypothetical protein
MVSQSLLANVQDLPPGVVGLSMDRDFQAEMARSMGLHSASSQLCASFAPSPDCLFP